MVSQKLKAAVKLSEKRAYKIAQEAGLHPSTLSRLINDIEIAKIGDPRVLQIGRVVGVPVEECFQVEGDEK
jgi:hypothetical protein